MLKAVNAIGSEDFHKKAVFFDADGTISITGGTVLAAGGSAGMGMNLSTTQTYVTFGSTGMGSMGNMGGQPGGFGASLISSGSTVTILDASGNTVYSGEAPCSAAFVFFSSADLNTDETYTLSADDASAATATAQTGTSTAQFGGQPGQMPGNGTQPGQPGDGQQPGGDPPAMPGSDTNSGNAV